MQSVRNLKNLGFKTNVHLIFSVNQAFLSAIVNSDYICPLIGRLDDTGQDAISNLIEMVGSFELHNFQTKIMASSIRNPQHVSQALKAGVDIVTAPSQTIEQMFYHPLTSQAYELFKEDLK